MEKEIALKLTNYFKGYKRKTITMDEMLSFVGEVEYEVFAYAIKKLIEEDMLIPVRSSGFTGRAPRIFSKYKVNTPMLRDKYISELEQISITLHRSINLEYYFSCSELVWEEDKESILKVDEYLKNNGLPKYFVGTPERSYRIFGDEKFVTHKHGKRLLERLQLYDAMKMTSGHDPAIFFINSEKFANNTDFHKHIVIEDRTTFHALSEVVHGSQLTSLVYGSGFDILSSIVNFPKQIDLQDGYHEYFYFGNLDYSGISIWNSAKDKVKIKLAVPFYKGLLQQESVTVRGHQKFDWYALKSFLYNFEPEEQEKIRTTLESGRYYPQGSMSQNDLQEIFLSCFGCE